MCIRDSYWGVALALLVAVGLVCWLVVVPVMHTRTAVARCRRNTDFIRREIEHLGGPEAAVDQLSLYVRLPEFLAPHRGTAVVMLGTCGGPAKTAVPLLITLLQEEDEGLRSNAAEALGRIGDRRAVEHLIKVLRNKEDPVRRDAATALGCLGGPRATDALIAVLKGQDSSLRSYAAGALSKSEDERAVDVLIEALNDRDRSVRGIAAAGLSHRGGPVVERLIGLLQVGSRYEMESAAEALGCLQDPRAVKPLEKILLTDPNSWAKRLAIDALVAIGEPAVDSLIAALRNPDPWIHQPVLRKIPYVGKPAVKPLIVLLGDKEVRLRVAAAYALGDIGDPRAIEPLKAALNDKHEEVREAAATALAGFNAPSIVEALRRSMNDEHECVRKAARWALSKLREGQSVER